MLDPRAVRTSTLARTAMQTKSAFGMQSQSRYIRSVKRRVPPPHGDLLSKTQTKVQ